MSNPTIPTADQLAETRIRLWRQSGDPLLTLESLRTWISHAGLVLFAPRPQQLPAPAPSLVEAVLGAPNPTPTLADTEQARILTARLIAEGSAVPLNLLGTPGTTGDTPDFLCSAAVFSYIFTLRGDKAWKQPPATTGPVKVSPLALATYEALAARVTLSAAALATELGKEVTEAAVLRALSELWSHLRVLPIPQQDNTVLWELMSTRFTKHIKAGANAGQPSALSALISLYLGMAVAATEEEIETILSPVAPRSRIRDIVHALTGARQLEAIAIDGRTVLHISGDLPAFAGATQGPEEEPIEVAASSTATEEHATDPASRITKFIARPRKTGTGFATRLTPRPGTGRPTSDRPDRERRPFQKKSFDSPRPSFTKPWDENRPGRPSINAEGASDAPVERPAFRNKPTFRREGGTRPTFRRDEGAPPRRDFTPRTDAPRSSADDQRPPRKTFSKPGTFGRKREEPSSRSSWGGSDSRPPRRDFNAGAGPRPADSRPSYGGGRSRRSSEGRPSFESGGGERRPGSYSPRPPPQAKASPDANPTRPAKAAAATHASHSHQAATDPPVLPSPATATPPRALKRPAKSSANSMPPASTNSAAPGPTVPHPAPVRKAPSPVNPAASPERNPPPAPARNPPAPSPNSPTATSPSASPAPAAKSSTPNPPAPPEPTASAKRKTPKTILARMESALASLLSSRSEAETSAFRLGTIYQ